MVSPCGPMPEPGAAELIGAPVPAMPRIGTNEIWFDSPFLVVDSGQRYSIGWQRWSERKGGPGFVVVRLTSLGSVKMLERFPLTDDGWGRAWQALIKLDAPAAETVRVKLRERESKDRAVLEREQLDADSLGCL